MVVELWGKVGAGGTLGPGAGLAVHDRRRRRVRGVGVEGQHGCHGRPGPWALGMAWQGSGAFGRLPCPWPWQSSAMTGSLGQTRERLE
jgi:hypothetical protein